MGVVSIKSTQNNLARICLAIAIRVAQQHEIRFLREINALGRQLKPDRQVNVIHEYGFLVRFSVAIRVLVNEDFVIRHLITRTIVRVSRTDRHPKPALVVEGHLHRIC